MRNSSCHVLALLLSSLALACSPVEDVEETCAGDKCDTPDGTAAQVCPLRRADAFAPGRNAFTHDAVRWPCNDVKGVNTSGGDDRGQEYCEYYAVVEKPDGEVVDLGRNTGDGTTPRAIELTDSEEGALRRDLGKVVGQCVFTSWHADIPGPLPSCRGGGGCPTLLGDVKLSTEFMRMKVDFNSNSAAVDLVQKCYRSLDKGPKDIYSRACGFVHETFGTGWRRSDPTICTEVMRLHDCGCGVDSDGDGKADINTAAKLAVALIPPEGLRGFPLGTWSAPDELPTGCRYADTGDDSHTIVTCDMTASDVLKNKNDPKGQCRARWANDVVVHIPLPVDKLVCDPARCDGEPWNIQP